MSNDYAFWYEPWPLTADEALERLRASQGTGDGLLPNPAVNEFFEELREMAERWATDPASTAAAWAYSGSDRLVTLNTPGSTPLSYVDDIVEAALRHGLVVYFPWAHEVALPPALRRQVWLHAGDGQGLPNPDHDVLRHLVVKALDRVESCVLADDAIERSYVVATPVDRSTSERPTFEIEYRLGSNSERFSFKTVDVEVVVGIFTKFRNADFGFTDDHPWARVP